MQRYHSVLHRIFTTLVLGGLAAVLICTATYLYLNPKLPSIDVLREAKLQVPLRIYSQNGELIGEFGEKLRTPIQMKNVPQLFVHAILSAEDDRFLKHQGVDITGLLRAASQLFISGRIQSGGSTITMQVARNFFLSSEKTFLRKFNEILLALQIEKELTKDQILELYINKIYLGKRAYGIQAAAGVYYGKSIEELDLAQLAMIAGLPKAPSAYNPINDPARAKIRRNWIIGRMYKLGHITKIERDDAIGQVITAIYHGPKLQLEAGYAAEIARATAVNKYGLDVYTDGYEIITTIDSKLQRSAKRALTKGLIDYDTRHGYRGAEEHFDLVDREDWLEKLKRLRTVNGLVPAVITKIETLPHNQSEAKPDAPNKLDQANSKATSEFTDYLDILLADGKIQRIAWDKTNNPLRSFVNENRKAPAIDHISEILTTGDVIRVRFNDAAPPRIMQLPAATGSLVALRPNDGAVAALVGGFDFKQSKFIRATQAYRQPGSNFKPFIYTAALANGFTPAHVINDAPIVFSDSQLESDWRPENSSGKFYGPTTLRRALYLSRNLVSVRLLWELGIDKAINYLDRFEFSSAPLPRDLSLALGSYAMTPQQVAGAYATLANGGFKIQPYLVTEIRDREKNIIFSTDPQIACIDCENTKVPDPTTNNSMLNNKTHTLNENQYSDEIDEADSLDDILTEPEHPINLAPRIVDARIVYIIDSILQDVIRRGTGIKAKTLGRSDLAGKTGTTNGPTDAWFSGYHPTLVATTWLGFDNNQLLGTREYGGSAALPIWIDFMRDALRGVPTAPRTRPPGMVAVKINRLTGLPSINNDSQMMFEFFREEYAPKSSNSSSSTANNDQLRLDEELF